MGKPVMKVRAFEKARSTKPPEHLKVVRQKRKVRKAKRRKFTNASLTLVKRVLIVGEAVKFDPKTAKANGWVILHCTTEELKHKTIDSFDYLATNKDEEIPDELMKELRGFITCSCCGTKVYQVIN
jgi:hypothetical protein